MLRINWALIFDIDRRKWEFECDDLFWNLSMGGMWKEKRLLGKDLSRAILQNSINPGFPCALPNLHQATLYTTGCSREGYMGCQNSGFPSFNSPSKHLRSFLRYTQRDWNYKVTNFLSVFFFFLVGWWISTLSTWKYYLGSFGKHWFLVTHFLSQKQWVWDKTRASGEFKYLPPPQEIPMHTQEPPALSKDWV